MHSNMNEKKDDSDNTEKTLEELFKEATIIIKKSKNLLKLLEDTDHEDQKNALNRARDLAEYRMKKFKKQTEKVSPEEWIKLHDPFESAIFSLNNTLKKVFDST